MPMTTVILQQYEGQLLWKPVRKLNWDSRGVKLALKLGDVNSPGILLVTIRELAACTVLLT